MRIHIGCIHGGAFSLVDARGCKGARGCKVAAKGAATLSMSETAIETAQVDSCPAGQPIGRHDRGHAKAVGQQCRNKPRRLAQSVVCLTEDVSVENWTQLR